MNKRPAKHSHLISIILLMPLVAALLVVSQTETVVSPLAAASLSVGYIVINAVYASYRKTFQVHTLVEFTLVGLIAYFALTSTV